MAGVDVAIADDGAAWFQNPAGLGTLGLKCEEGKTWGNDIIGTYAKLMGDSAWGVTWSGWDPAKMLGFGAGYGDIQDEGKGFGVGFGMNVGTSPFSWGVNVMRQEPEFGDNETTFALGALYRVPQRDKAPIRLGLRVDDATQQFSEGRQFDFGVAWPATNDLLIAADVNSFNDSDDRTFNVGAEYALGTYKEWRVRAGAVDNGDGHDLALGAGYAWKTWRLDAAWQNTDFDNTWSVGAGFGF